MISHTTLGTNDLEKAEFFYDEFLKKINGEKFLKTDRAIFYSFQGHESKLAISQPFNGEPATTGNGTMVSFSVESEARVQELHEYALSLGAENEGDPGVRYNGMYYGAYFRDLDGNKFAIFHVPAKPGA
ncbi:VOC family protein [Microbulbifer sp. SH-1]|uniref:VOC family protein n=1 Tax=Microbulbifer sp. SH-1 TaxID=2681547 RepID=UPI00140819EC|nr:VOC family protein [Microbulbifer sp. SH-1]QIL89091.1 VOC family protein [Microbulbifer sp. SH-1]